MKNKWRLIYHYDVWGNPEDGFEVNDSREAGIIELTEEATNEEIISIIKEHLYIFDDEIIRIEWNSDETITIDETTTGRPLFTLWKKPT